MSGLLALTMLATIAAAVLSAAAAAQAAEKPAPGAEPLAASGHARDRMHRSLVLARVVTLLVSGTALAWTIRATEGEFSRLTWGVASLLAIVLLVDGIARAVGNAYTSRAWRVLGPVSSVLRLPVLPVVALGVRLEEALHRLLPPQNDEEAERAATAEQFREVVTSDAEVTRDERMLLHGVFTLGETEVREVMVPRVEVNAIDHDTPWSEVVDRLRSSGHARMPVFADVIDDVLGVLYAKDLLPAIVADREPEAGWLSLVRPAEFIPATKTLDAQLRDFKSSGNHIAIVADEYGGMAGVVTIEDILEEIVGEIRDEHDEEESELEWEGDDRFWASGRLPIDQLSLAVGHEFAHDNVTTVGGLVYERLGRVPRPGETFVAEGFKVVVERVVRRRVQRVYFERLPERASVRFDEDDAS